MTPKPDATGPLLVAHKGVWSDLHVPQNTLEACLRALDHGFEAVEVDIQMTADGVLVLGHDDGTTRISTVRGKVSALPWARLAGASLTHSATWPLTQLRRARVRHSTPFTRLEDLLQRLLPDPRLRWLWLDLKVRDPRAYPALAELLHRAPPEARARAVVNHGSVPGLERLRTLLPPEVGTSYEEFWGSEPLRETDRYLALKGRAITHQGVNLGLPAGHQPLWRLWGREASARRLLPAFMRRCEAEGVPVIFWTVNDPAALCELSSHGPHAILTDLPRPPSSSA